MRSLASTSADNWLLLQEHEHTYTLGKRTDPDNVFASAAASGAEIIRADRGGDVTYHGPGQLVGYPIITLPGHKGGDLPDTVAYVTAVEQILIDTVAALGGPALGRVCGYPGVWADFETTHPSKVAAIGVRLAGCRTTHGFALNVDPDLSMFDHIVPCGISEFSVTSLRRLGMDVSMKEVVDTLVPLAAARWGHDNVDRADVVWPHDVIDLAPFSLRSRHGSTPAPTDAPTTRQSQRRSQAGVTTAVAFRDRKPEFLRAKIHHSANVRELRQELRSAQLVTVCEEAGCPNLSECWTEGTATFMINGDRCTRACGFCLVDTRKPEPPDMGEAARVADAVLRLGLSHAVITTVARDDLADGGAAGFVSAIDEIRNRCAGTTIEVLISDCKGDPASLDAIFGARPDVLNHNLETVARLQRVARPSASYARSLAVLARSVSAGLMTKSGLVLGMGETAAEIRQSLHDLAAVGVQIVTMGQYLRPTAAHLPIANYWTPDDFEEFGHMATAEGIRHVESSPFTRSSHHAGRALEAVTSASGTSASGTSASGTSASGTSAAR